MPHSPPGCVPRCALLYCALVHPGGAGAATAALRCFCNALGADTPKYPVRGALARGVVKSSIASSFRPDIWFAYSGEISNTTSRFRVEGLRHPSCNNPRPLANLIGTKMQSAGLDKMHTCMDVSICPIEQKFCIKLWQHIACRNL